MATGFVNAGGYEGIAPTLTRFHALDSALDADLTGGTVLAQDRYHALTSRLAPPRVAYDVLRLKWRATRAGSRFAPRYVRVKIDITNQAIAKGSET